MFPRKIVNSVYFSQISENVKILEKAILNNQLPSVPVDDVLSEKMNKKSRRKH